MPIAVVVVLVLVAIVALYRNASRTAAQPEPAPSPHEANVTAADFAEMVLQTSNDVPVLVDFYAAWCPPCRYLGPVLSEMACNYQGHFLLAKVDVDACPSLAEAHRVTSMPTVILFRNGRSVARFSGARPERSIRFFLSQNGVFAPQPGAADPTT